MFEFLSLNDIYIYRVNYHTNWPAGVCHLSHTRLLPLHGRADTPHSCPLSDARAVCKNSQCRSSCPTQEKKQACAHTVKLRVTPYTTFFNHSSPAKISQKLFSNIKCLKMSGDSDTFYKILSSHRDVGSDILILTIGNTRVSSWLKCASPLSSSEFIRLFCVLSPPASLCGTLGARQQRKTHCREWPSLHREPSREPLIKDADAGKELPAFSVTSPTQTFNPPPVQKDDALSSGKNI